MSPRQIVDVLFAIEHASHVGLQPTHMITINWQQMGVIDSVKANGSFLKYLKDAAARRGWPTSHIWIREVGPVIGDHVHMLVHLPPQAAGWLARNKSRWLKRCGAVRVKGGSMTSRIHGRPLVPSSEVALSELYQANIDAVTNYVLKHCDPVIGEAFGIRPNGPCTVLGRRVSISRNLHHKARSKCSACNAS